jgi:hypothetical protein
MLDHRKLAMLAALVVAIIAGMTGVATVSAQEGSPTPAECVSPGLPPGTPTPMEEGMEGMDMASPSPTDATASPEAMEEVASPEPMPMPEATPMPEGQPADDETAAAIVEFLTNYAACLDQGWSTDDPALYVALESQNFIMESTGTGNPYDRVANEMGSPFPGFDLKAVTNPLTYDDGRVSGDVSGLAGHWVVNIRAFLIQEDGEWKYDAEVFLPPDVSDYETVSVVGIDLVEVEDEATGERTYEFAFPGGSTTFPQTEAFVFTVANAGVELHEAIVVQLPEGADPLGLLDGSVAFEDVVFYGGVFGVAPEQTAQFALVDLEPGIYTLVCFFPSPEGVPHAALGMVAQFEIVAPAA